MQGLPIESFIVECLEAGGWRVIHRQADLIDRPIADFVSHDDALEWVGWKCGHPKLNPHETADELDTYLRPVEIALEPKLKADGERLSAVLVQLADEDPSFRFSFDRESRQIIVKGVSESHLDGKISVLRDTYGIEPRVGAPQVAFRERITRPAEMEYTHKNQSGGVGEFASVKLHVAPNVSGGGYRFESRVAAGRVPARYVSAIEAAVASVLSSGVVAGFPVVDIKVALVDAKYHDADSSVRAFEIAARSAFRSALRKGGSELLEPIMAVEVVTPQDHASAIVADLHRRRGQIERQETCGDAVIVKAMVPLMTMFGYANNLHAMSEGRGVFTMQFEHYAPATSPEGEPPFRPAIGMRA